MFTSDAFFNTLLHIYSLPCPNVMFCDNVGYCWAISEIDWWVTEFPPNWTITVSFSAQIPSAFQVEAEALLFHSCLRWFMPKTFCDRGDEMKGLAWRGLSAALTKRTSLWQLPSLPSSFSPAEKYWSGTFCESAGYRMCSVQENKSYLIDISVSSEVYDSLRSLCLHGQNTLRNLPDSRNVLDKFQRPFKVISFIMVLDNCYGLQMNMLSWDMFSSYWV